MTSSDKYLKRTFETSIGIHPSTNDDARPAKGYVVTKSQLEARKKLAKENGGNYGADAIYEIEDEDAIGDGISALGDIQVILRPEVSKRTSYMRGDPMSSGGRPVSMNSDNREDILDSIMNSDGPNSKSHMADAMINLLQSHLKKKNDNINKSRTVSPGQESSNKSNLPMHAEILGGYSIDDIEGIYYPFSKIQKISSSTDISDLTKNLVSEQDLITRKVSRPDAALIVSRLNSGKLNISSVNSLREYKTALAIRKKYKDKGIGYVLFAHKKGINIDKPTSYDPLARKNETVEEVLIRMIKEEVLSTGKKIASDIRKSMGEQ